MANYTVLGHSGCAPCRAIKPILKEGVMYVDVNEDPDAAARYLELSRRRETPQLFIDGKFLTTDVQQIKGLVCK